MATVTTGRSHGSYTSIILSTVAADSTATIPAGHYIQHIFIENTTANAITGGVKIGTTAGGIDILVALAVGASAITFVTDALLLKRWFSTSADQTIYIEDVTAWNSASLTVTIVLGRL